MLQIKSVTASFVRHVWRTALEMRVSSVLDCPPL